MVGKWATFITIEKKNNHYEPSHDDVPAEEALYNFSHRNGAEDMTEGKVYNKLSHGVQKPSHAALVSAQEDATYNHISVGEDQSSENTYNTIPQNLQPSGSEEATYNHLFHDIQGKHATVGSLY